MDKNQEKNYLGVDWGEKRIGLSLADGETKIAVPFKTVSNIRELLEAIEAELITDLVIGSPGKMSGVKISNRDYLSFVSKLKERSLVNIINYDERLSSKAADVLGYGQKDRASRDEGAATIILQSYLDSL